MPSASTAMARLSLAMLVALTAAAGCGGGAAPQPAAEDEAAAATPGRETEETVFEDLVQTQDKARAVEDLTLGRKDALDRALEAGDEPGQAE